MHAIIKDKHKVKFNIIFLQKSTFMFIFAAKI